MRSIETEEAESHPHPSSAQDALSTAGPLLSTKKPQEGSIPGRAEPLTQLLHQALGLLVLGDVGEQLPAGRWDADELSQGQLYTHHHHQPHPSPSTSPCQSLALVESLVWPTPTSLFIPSAFSQRRVHPTLLRNFHCECKFVTKTAAI